MAEGDGRAAPSSRRTNDHLREDVGSSTAREDESTEQGSLGKRVTFHFENGDVYEGELRDGMKHGKGVCKFTNGDVYDGEWKDDEMHGRGTVTYANGCGYEGEWKDSTITGVGTYNWASGDVCHGSFKNGLPHGKGIARFANGNVYDGEWKDNRHHGKGTYKWKNGDVHEGEFKDGLQHGKGTLKYASGDVYEGKFKEGIPHGKGALKYSSGGIFEGIWTVGQMTEGKMRWGKYALSGEEKRKVYNERELRSQRSQHRRIPADKKACEHCGVDDYRYKLRVCSACGLALYCSLDCQMAASGSHQRICNIRSELPSRDSDRLVLKYDREKMVDLDAGLRYATKYLDGMKHLEISVRNLGGGDKVVLSAKQLSSLLRAKKGALESISWASEGICVSGISNDDQVWKELHGLTQLWLEFMIFDDVQCLRDIIGQQKNTLHVLSLPFLAIGWSKAKCRRTLAQAVSACKNLVKLDLMWCVLTDSDLKMMLNDLPKLRVLYLGRHRRHSHEFTDNTCGLIARKCPGLQDLHLRHHNQLSVRGIRKIFEGCIHLRSFDTTTCKLSCGDIRQLLDIAPQLLCLSLDEKIGISGGELDAIIEATGGRTLFRFGFGAGVGSATSFYQPLAERTSAKTKEKRRCQVDLMNKIQDKKNHPQTVNEWEDMLEG